jgi:hypothetical protein
MTQEYELLLPQQLDLGGLMEFYTEKLYAHSFIYFSVLCYQIKLIKTYQLVIYFIK